MLARVYTRVVTRLAGVQLRTALRAAVHTVGHVLGIFLLLLWCGGLCAAHGISRLDRPPRLTPPLCRLIFRIFFEVLELFERILRHLAFLNGLFSIFHRFSEVWGRILVGFGLDFRVNFPIFLENCDSVQTNKNIEKT